MKITKPQNSKEKRKRKARKKEILRTINQPHTEGITFPGDIQGTWSCWKLGEDLSGNVLGFALPFLREIKNPSGPLQRRKKNPKVYFKMETNISVTCESSLGRRKIRGTLKSPHFLA